MSIEDICARIDTKWVLITGGEPLLSEDVYGLFDMLYSRTHNIVLETNGSIDVSRVLFL